MLGLLYLDLARVRFATQCTIERRCKDNKKV